MAQDPAVAYPPPLDRPGQPPSAPPESETGPGRVSPQSVLLGAGAVQVFDDLPHLSAELTSAVNACEHWLEGARRPSSADPRPRRSPGTEL